MPIYVYLAKMSSRILQHFEKFNKQIKCRPDNISIKVFKSSSDNILLVLSHVFHLSMTKSDFIDCFKLDTVCPVFKKGNFNNINNYRPVSLLSNISKLVEKVIYNRLFFYKFFYNYQFGFRKNHSTAHAISILVEKISQSFACKNATLEIFLNLSKAFDTIDHLIGETGARSNTFFSFCYFSHNNFFFQNSCLI